jgi:hypothetical protein
LTAALQVLNEEKQSNLNPYAKDFVPFEPPQRQPLQQPPPTLQLQQQLQQLQQLQLQQQQQLPPQQPPQQSRRRGQPKREVVQTLDGSLQITFRTARNPRR